MKKPVIFFSHSARDRDALLSIRERLLAGTGNTIEVFMASDGESIPFGKNWIQETEAALEGCGLMFVWLSPASQESDWILFESGFAYGKGITVVPVGFLGVRLEEVAAPLAHLQGFNITSAGGLNNLITVINRNFDTTFNPFFDEDFYGRHIAEVEPDDPPGILEYVDSIRLSAPPKLTISGSSFRRRIDSLEEVKTFLGNYGAISEGQKDGLLGLGFRAAFIPYEAGGHSLVVTIDPMALNATRKSWEKVFVHLYGPEIPFAAFLSISLVRSLELPSDEAFVSARLLASEISFDTRRPYKIYGFRNVEFLLRPHEGAEGLLRLYVPRDNAAVIPLLSLMRLLAERRIISRRGEKRQEVASRIGNDG